MVRTIEMQEIRYLNLFENISKVRTKYCFHYNNAIVFCVPKKLISKAIGEKGKNIKKIQNIIGRKIKIVPVPESIEDAEEFIQAIINPFTFKDLNVTNNEIIVSAGKNKAALIGRGKRRLNEMEKVTKGFFDKDFRVV